MNTSHLITNHPFHPLGVEIPSYLANTLSVPTLLAIFFTGCTVILGTTYKLMTWRNPNLGRGDLSVALWFALCGFIHLFFEGFFAYNFREISGSSHLFGQLWKEYSLSDSRYLTQDSFVTCMEAITAIFWGPLSFTIVFMIATDHPMRYALQSIVSLGQLYGDVLYYATCSFDKFVVGVVYSRPEAYYYYGYYVLMNSFWIVIPLGLVWQSVVETGSAFAKVQAERREAKGTKKTL